MENRLALDKTGVTCLAIPLATLGSTAAIPEVVKILAALESKTKFQEIL